MMNFYTKHIVNGMHYAIRYWTMQLNICNMGKDAGLERSCLHIAYMSISCMAHKKQMYMSKVKFNDSKRQLFIVGVLSLSSQ